MGSKVEQGPLQGVMYAIMGPTVCTQYQYTAVMFSPAVMGMEKWAGLPGVLHGREALSTSKMGLFVIHFRCGISEVVVSSQVRSP